jgi:hypothetical protein
MSHEIHRRLKRLVYNNLSFFSHRVSVFDEMARKLFIPSRNTSFFITVDMVVVYSAKRYWIALYFSSDVLLFESQIRFCE